MICEVFGKKKQLANEAWIIYHFSESQLEQSKKKQQKKQSQRKAKRFSLDCFDQCMAVMTECIHSNLPIDIYHHALQLQTSTNLCACELAQACPTMFRYISFQS